MREVELPSGAMLKITPAPFSDSKALYQAVLSELKDVSLGSKTEFGDLYKTLFCVGFSSKTIERCLWECFKRCTHNDVRITLDTFEPLECRDDYMKVCIEVAKDNIGPFGKSLFAEYQHALSMIESTQKSKQPMT